MAKVSIIIPSRGEQFLPQTAADLLNKGGDIELIVVQDGPPYKELPEDTRLIQIRRGEARGMRAGINDAVSISTGEFIMKVDGHCMFGEGYDTVLQSDCEDNWIVIPRRYSLDAELWKPRDKEFVDSMYYFYPPAHPDDLGLHGRPWYERGRARRDILIDTDLTFQGSCWFMTKAHWERIGGVEESGYETFMGEPQEIGFKTQLGPWKGEIMRNKKTWYAHLHKGKQYGRGYFMSSSERTRGNSYSFDFWWNNKWDKRVMDIEDLLDKWMPMPGWVDNWKEIKNGLA